MSLDEIIVSGLLELYFSSSLNEEEKKMIMAAVAKYPQLGQVMQEIELALSLYGEAHAIRPHDSTKPFLLATIDYMDRLKNGEVLVSVPVLNKDSKVKDYEQWLNRPDMQTPVEMDNIHARIISHEVSKITAIVWMRFGSLSEVHNDEHEKFLVLQGNCTVTVGVEKHYLKPGDYMEIPLHVNHHVDVTSDTVCKALLQRTFVAQ